MSWIFTDIVYNKLETLNNTEILDESGSFKTYEKVEHEFDMVAVEAGHIRRLARISGGATRYKSQKPRYATLGRRYSLDCHFD